MSDALNPILSALALVQEMDKDVLRQLEGLLTKPPPDIPAHVGHIFAQAREVFGEDAARWLATPHFALGHKIPLQVAQDAAGAQRVEDLLTRIVVGMPV
jgi:putative toxin-antitoxin system antitoxin component (TIGR02293 family)